MSPENMRRAAVAAALFLLLWSAAMFVFISRSQQPTARETAAEVTRQTTAGAGDRAPTGEITRAAASPAEQTAQGATASPEASPPSEADPFGKPVDLPQARDNSDTPPSSDNPKGAPSSGDGTTGGRTTGRAPGSNGAPQQGPGQSPGQGPRQSPEPAPAALSETERNRAKAAAYNFVLYAYGTPTDDPVQYEAYVNQAVVPGSFEGSPGARDVAAVAEAVAAPGGHEDRLLATDLSVVQEREGAATIDARFEVSGPDGDERALRQRLEAEALGPVWKVAKAAALEDQP